MSESDNPSLGEIDELLGYKAQLLQALRPVPPTYEVFIEILYDDIDKGVRRLIHNKNVLNDAGAGEDLITAMLLEYLAGKEYEAIHSINIGGNVDLSIQSADKNFNWIGEAKKYTNIGNGREGFLQLTSRYSSGVNGEDQGGLLLYMVDVQHASDHMSNWKAELESNMSLCNSGIKTRQCSKQPLAFFSIHKHESSGLPFTVRHIPVCLYHKPLDASARKKKLNAKKRTAKVLTKKSQKRKQAQ